MIVTVEIPHSIIGEADRRFAHSLGETVDGEEYERRMNHNISAIYVEIYGIRPADLWKTDGSWAQLAKFSFRDHREAMLFRLRHP